MPAMQVTIHHLNERFSPGSIGDQDVGLFAEELSFRNVIADNLRIGEEFGSGFGDFLDTMPDAMAQAIQATLRSAIRRKQPVTFAWKPGYEWEFSMTDVSDAGTPGGITIVIRSRYPADRSPVDSSANKSH